MRQKKKKEKIFCMLCTYGDKVGKNENLQLKLSIGIDEAPKKSRLCDFFILFYSWSWFKIFVFWKYFSH